MVAETRMSGFVSLRSFARWSDERMQLRVVPPVRTARMPHTLWRRSTERGFCGCLLPSIRGCPLARARLGGVACDDSLPPAAGEAACDSLPEAGEACDSLPHAGEEACDSESDSLLPHGDAATPHHDWLRASKHRTELRRHDATAPAIDPLPRNLSTNGADVCERGHTQTHASC